MKNQRRQFFLLISLVSRVFLFITILHWSYQSQNVRGVRARLQIPVRIESPTGLTLDNDGNLYVIQSLDDINVLRFDSLTRFITAYAGHGGEDDSGDGGSAIRAGLGNPTGLAVDKEGNLFISQLEGKVRFVDRKTLRISTIAGNGKLGDGGTGDRGPAIKASFGRPVDIALDSQGNIYVCDDLDHRVRRIDAKTGIILTYAGGGNRELGDGLPATQATLKFPTGIAFDKADNLFIADFEHNRIRRVDAKTGIITTIAGTGHENAVLQLGRSDKVNIRYPRKIALDNIGNIFVNGGWGHSILRIDSHTGMVTRYVGTGVKGFSGDGKLANKAKISGPSGMVFDQSGNLFFSDYGNNRLRRVDAKTHRITTFEDRY